MLDWKEGDAPVLCYLYIAKCESGLEVETTRIFLSYNNAQDWVKKSYEKAGLRPYSSALKKSIFREPAVLIEDSTSYFYHLIGNHVFTKLEKIEDYEEWIQKREDK